MAPPDRLVALGARGLQSAHRALLKLSGGRFPKTVFGMQPVELHTTGRKSGLRRSTMLTAPIVQETRVVLVASKGGYRDHPDWYKNLVANPDIELTVGGQIRRMRARTASADEKRELWPGIVGAYKGYAGYQRKTERDIPVVICEPVEAAGPAGPVGPR